MMICTSSFFMPHEGQEEAISHRTPKTGLLKQTGITVWAVRAWGLRVASGCCMWVHTHHLMYARNGKIASEPNSKTIP